MTTYGAIIDCSRWEISFQFSGVDKFVYKVFKGVSFPTMINMSCAKRMINRGCIAFLATVVDVSNERPTLESIPIVREFPDVFSPDLPGLPLDREIEFCIDLVCKVSDF